MLLKEKELASALRGKMGNRNQEEFAAWLTSEGIHVNQATISRLLNGQCRTATPKIQKICIYAGINWKLYVRRERPETSERLMEALGDVWDGTKEHEAWLARVITIAGSARP